MDADEAWMEFCKNSARVQKSSINEKLDALAAALNDIRGDTARTAQVVPKVLGDDAALDTANQEAGQSPEGGGLGEDVTGEEDMSIGTDEENTVPEETGGAPAPLETPVEGGAGPDAGAGPAGEAPVQQAPAAGPAGDEGPISDEELSALLGESPEGEAPAPEAPMAEAPAEAPAEEATAEPEEAPAAEVAPMAEDVTAPEGAGVQAASENLIAALKQAAHEALDANDMARIKELAKVEAQVQQAVDKVSAPSAESGATDELADNLAGNDTDGASEQEESDGEKEPAEEKAPAEDEAPASEESDGEKEPAEKENDKDKPEKTEKSASIPSMFLDRVEKSKGPTLKQMMKGKMDLESFLKANKAQYVDGTAIDTDYVDGDCEERYTDSAGIALLKSDDRIASALNIFRKPDTSGETDPASMAAAGTAAEALSHTGETDPDSISTAEPVSKSDDGISEAGTASEALSHEGEQDPGSIATADSIAPEETDSNLGTVHAAKSDDGPDAETEQKRVLDDMREHYKDDPAALELIGAMEYALDGMEKCGDVEKGLANPAPAKVEKDGVNPAPAEVPGGGIAASDDMEKCGGVEKSGGVRMMTLGEMMMSFAKSDRPGLMATAGSDVRRPELEGIAKSAERSHRVRMGHGVSPKDVIAADIEEYNLYKSRASF